MFIQFSIFHLRMEMNYGLEKLIFRQSETARLSAIEVNVCFSGALFTKNMPNGFSKIDTDIFSY